MDGYRIDFNDKNVVRAIRDAYRKQCATGIRTFYRPAVKTKRVDRTQTKDL